MTGTLAKFILFYHLIKTLHAVLEPSFLSLYSLLGCLEKIRQVLNMDDRKSTSSGYFFYLVTLKPLSLRSGLFLPYMLGQPYFLYFESNFVFFFQ
jgi:hypothetical protein